MGSLPGILLLVLGLLLSVGLHEIGHLLPAKKFGVKVPQYFIGFGPTVWSTTKGETEYGLKALPLGGYVRLAGMVWPGRQDRQQVNRRGNVTIAEETRRASAEELSEQDQPRAFWRLNAGKRLIVMFGGPLMNFLTAAVLLAVVMSGSAHCNRQIRSRRSAPVSRRRMHARTMIRRPPVLKQESSPEMSSYRGTVCP